MVSPMASAARGRSSRHVEQQRAEQHGRARGGGAQADLVGDGALHDAADGIQRADEHHEHAHHPAAQLGRRAQLRDRREARQRTEVEPADEEDRDDGERERRRERVQHERDRQRVEHAQQDPSGPEAGEQRRQREPHAHRADTLRGHERRGAELLLVEHVERDRRDQGDERRRQQRVERHAPDDEAQRGIAADEARALRGSSPRIETPDAPAGGGSRNDATTANTAKKLRC